jgi:hypothetical protein
MVIDNSQVAEPWGHSSGIPTLKARSVLRLTACRYSGLSFLGAIIRLSDGTFPALAKRDSAL